MSDGNRINPLKNLYFQIFEAVTQTWASSWNKSWKKLSSILSSPTILFKLTLPSICAFREDDSNIQKAIWQPNPNNFLNFEIWALIV